MIQKLIFHTHLEEGEKIVYAVHKHWVNFLRPTLMFFFFGLAIPWGLYAIGLNTILFFWVVIIWSFLAFFSFIHALIDWYGDVLLITNMGIVWVKWGGFFKNAATRMSFEDVEGVAYEINGFWPAVLNYGKVNLKSLSGNNLALDPARRPKEAELKIMQIQQGYIKNREMEDAGKLKQLLSQMVASHFSREGK